MRFGIDNGAWKAYQSKRPFDEARFWRLVERHGTAADFVVIPDIVAGGPASLSFSLSWMHRLRQLRQLLLPVQDGIQPLEIGRVLRQYPNVGIFLGGSTAYKLRTMTAWGLLATACGRWYHVGRVNTARRIRLCLRAGATSFDGTSASMYASSLPLLDTARNQPAKTLWA
jgi:hypothetical protein